MRSVTPQSSPIPVGRRCDAITISDYAWPGIRFRLRDSTISGTTATCGSWFRTGRRPTCLTRQWPTAPRSSTRTGAQGRRSSSVMGGHCTQIAGNRRCCFSHPTASAASGTIVEVMGVPLRLGTATTWTRTRATSATLIEALDLRDVTLVGFSTGGGEVARYLGRYGSERVAKAALVSSVPPFMLKTDDNPGGVPISAFDELRDGSVADRSQLYRELADGPFFGNNRPGANVSQGMRDCLLAAGDASRPQERPRLYRSVL